MLGSSTNSSSTFSCFCFSCNVSATPRPAGMEHGIGRVFHFITSYLVDIYARFFCGMDFPTLSGRSIFCHADLGLRPKPRSLALGCLQQEIRGRIERRCFARSACRLAADWRSGRTPALPYPPAGNSNRCCSTPGVKMIHPTDADVCLNGSIHAKGRVERSRRSKADKRQCQVTVGSF
jgi:hypothetical protein